MRETFTPATWSAFADCSAVVGMHPDQATEAIADFAIAHRKPFAIVPCCVFPQLHPERVDPGEEEEEGEFRGGARDEKENKRRPRRARDGAAAARAMAREEDGGQGRVPRLPGREPGRVQDDLRGRVASSTRVWLEVSETLAREGDETTSARLLRAHNYSVSVTVPAATVFPPTLSATRPSASHSSARSTHTPFSSPTTSIRTRAR